MIELSGKPVVFWFLNADLEADELRGQLRAMKAAGIGGTFMHWIIGGPGYMSETWLRALDVVVEESAKLGMDAWLYDEAWCPSCYAGGIILAERPDLQAKTIWHEKIDAHGGEKVKFDFDLMKLLSAVALPVENGIPRISRAIDLQPFIGPRAEEIEKPYRHDWGYYPISEPKLHWRAAKKGDMRWELEWEAPSVGNWRIYLFCQRDALQWDGINRLDVLNPESIHYFIGETHAKYAERYSSYFGSVIPGIMTDEFKYVSPAWTEKLPKLFEERHSENLMDLLPALFDESLPEYKTAKANYQRLVSDLFFENYTLPMRKWCEDNDLILTGHISPEEHASTEILCAGNIARHISAFDMPGCDIIIQAVGDSEHPELNLSPILAKSAAHQKGLNRVFVEAGACGNEDLSLEFLKHLFDWLMVQGVNFINIHGFSYSLSGYKKFLAGQTLDAYGNLLKHFKPLADHVEEMCELLTDYRPSAKIAVLKPMAALRVDLELPGEVECLPIDRALTDLSMALIERHLEFDLLDEDCAEEWSVDSGALRVGEAEYDVALIPECGLLSKAAYDKLAKFAESGRTVIAQGGIPEIISETAVSSADDEFLAFAKSAEDAAEIADPNTENRLSISGPDAKTVQVLRGEDGRGERICFVVNMSSDSPADITLNSENDSLEIQLAPRESRVVPLPFASSSDDEKREFRGILTPLSDWRVNREKENHIPLESGMRIEVLEGAKVKYLVCDKSNFPELKKSVMIDGATPDWDVAEEATFYTAKNILAPVGAQFAPGTHIVEFDAESMPTLLLTGDFAAEMKNADHAVLRKSVETSATVSRVGIGCPYIRGEITFETEFELEEEIEDAEFRLTRRKGSIEVIVDGDSKGIAAWNPNVLKVGHLAKGPHTVALKVVGDGIGLYHEGYNEAGCGEIEIFGRK